MKYRSLLIVSALLMLCHAPAHAIAEESSEAVSGSTVEETTTSEQAGTMARIKKAHTEMKNGSDQIIEAPQLIPETGPVMKNAMFFIALLMIGFSVFKRFSGSKADSNSSEAIEVLSRKALSSRASLVIVQIGDQSLLLSQTNEDIQFLTELKSQADFGQAIAGVNLLEHSAPKDSKEMRSALG